ncbi:tRNA dihydrouridine synthase DusB [Candidatus Contubernalis alkaliaceticus]|uniref:tRNA dihydrouridine synthase DusB n=1 Tax=Candidatus Contubernalis alkaliaceticus TaxID=338645 RepID=UPI001F4C5028|nr:tRNA dihydrouridine synthase DusB [Candidatus Contubernalis alkalaceticus]
MKQDNLIFLAPMAGVTNSAFRTIARKLGSSLVFTEMVNARGLLEKTKKSLELICFREEERPIALQLFGSDPVLMAEAACVGVEAGFDLIDLNMGCPTPKIVKNGDGAALMRNLPLARVIIDSVSKAVKVPVTLKVRKGWSEGDDAVFSLACYAEEAGLHWITVHGRTREQFYSGKADWEIIGAIKASFNIPVIGNGDVRGPLDCIRMMEETRCDGVMIGRGALGNPWIFQQCRHYLETGNLLPGPPVREVLKTCLRHLSLLVDLKGERIGVREMRKHASWYFREFPGAAALRREINTCESVKDMKEVLAKIKE